MDQHQRTIINSPGERGVISLALNDMALASQGYWYPAQGEFEIGQLPPNDYKYWTLTGLTYPLLFIGADGHEWSTRVVTIPPLQTGGVRFRIYHDPDTVDTVAARPGPRERMSPAQQRLAGLLGTNKEETRNEQFLFWPF